MPSMAVACSSLISCFPKITELQKTAIIIIIIIIITVEPRFNVPAFSEILDSGAVG
jgi:hypothetical protein